MRNSHLVRDIYCKSLHLTATCYDMICCTVVHETETIPAVLVLLSSIFLVSETELDNICRVCQIKGWKPLILCTQLSVHATKLHTNNHIQQHASYTGHCSQQKPIKTGK